MSARRDMRNAEREWLDTPRAPLPPYPVTPRKDAWIAWLCIVIGLGATAWLAGWL